MPGVQQTIQLLVAPVIMISACGLLCLALYNRLAAIVSRARAFHKERFDAQGKLAAAGERAATDPALQHLGRRVETLDDQVLQILRRARMVRNSLACLLLTVLCMLACSLALGMSLLSPLFATVALTLFLLGVVTAILGMVLALAELRRALDPVVLEYSTFELGEETREQI